MIVLTAEEIADLTGKRRPSAQMRMLDSMGIPYRKRPGQAPAVLRIHVETPSPQQSGTLKKRPQLRP